MESAQNQKKQILITDVTSYLGVELARSLLSQNCIVFGVGKPHREQLGAGLAGDLLQKSDFTLLETDLAQPLPSYLPAFDLIFHLISHVPLFTKSAPASQNLSRSADFLPTMSNIIFQAKEGNSQLIIIAPISNDSNFYDYLTQDIAQKNVKLFLVGDLYGPRMPLASEQSILGKLIAQAVGSDKVILENEGLDMVYPAYISDIIFAVNKFVFAPDYHKNIHFLISESPKTALSVAYEIQNAARMTLQKDLGLFYAGQSIANHNQQVTIKPHDLGYTPKINLREGLKKTFEYFAKLSPPGLNTQIPHFQRRSTQQLPETTYAATGGKNLRSKIKSNLFQAKTSLTSKIRRDGPGLKIKTFLILTFFLAFLLSGKTVFDVYWGASMLSGAQKSLVAGDFKKAQQQAESSQKSFISAQKMAGIILYPAALLLPGPTHDFIVTLDALSALADSSAHFVRGTEVLVQDIAQVLDSKTKTEGFDTKTPSADFKNAYTQSLFAATVLENSQKSLPFKSKIEIARKSALQLSQLASIAYEGSNLLDDIIGNGSPRNYLVLLQNNTELRPGGGFIGNFAEISFVEGKLKNITVEDIYTIDGQLKEKIELPPELKAKLGIGQFYLRDSNWSPDSTLNAKTARDFFKKETGKDVDGIIMVDLTLVQNILSKIGPIKLADYDNEEINAQNLFERGEYHAEIGFFPGSTAKRDFLGSLERTLISNILASSSSSWPALFDVIKESLQEKHIIASVDNPTVASYVATHNWNNQFPPPFFNPADDSVETRDFLALSEANLGANKVNRFLDRKISYEATIGRDADLVAKLTITYTNKSQAETWPAGKYVNFLRVYAPFAAGLFEHKNGDVTDLNGVTITTQGALTVFSTFVEVPVKSQKEVSFTYRIPKNIKLEKAPLYHLYVQKQPGTEKDPLEFRFNLPGYLIVKSVNQNRDQSGLQNLLVETDLATDRQFQIEVAKK